MRSSLPNIGKALRIVLIAAAIFFIGAFAIGWLGFIAGMAAVMPFLTNFFPGQELLTIIGMLSMLFVIGLPLLGIILFIVRLAFGRRIGKNWSIGLIVLWFISFFTLASIGGSLAQDFMIEETIEEPVSAAAFAADTVQLSYYKLESQTDRKFHFGRNAVSLPPATATFRIVKSEDAQWGLNQRVTARSRRAESARELARELYVPLEMSTGSLSVPQQIPFENLSKWRAQEVEMVVAVPVGAYVRMNRRVASFGRMSLDQRPEGDGLYRMSQDGRLICQDCAPAASESTTMTTNIDAPETATELSASTAAFSGYSGVQISGPVKVLIEYGDTYDYRVTGNAADLESIEAAVDDGQLLFHLPGEAFEEVVRLIIQTPTLNSIDLTDTDDVRIKGFNSNSLLVNAQGNLSVNINSTVQQLTINASQEAEVEFTGEAEQLVASVDNARLETDRGRVNQAQLNAQNGSRVKLGAGTNINQQVVSDDSKLRIDE